MSSCICAGAALLSATLASLIQAGAAGSPISVYDQGIERIPDTRLSDLRAIERTYSMPGCASLEEWEARAAWLRDHVRASTGLLPWPGQRPPVEAHVFDRYVGEGYSVEKVYFESRPGLFVTGNLYRPLDTQGPFPAVASPHGHWQLGRLHHDDLGSLPGRGIGLARRGMVAFLYDMMGYVDADQMEHRWSDARGNLWGVSVAGMQTFNSVRVLDFLSSLPDVDPDRLAVTGASGGGTQTFLLVAVDERPAAAAPVNMVSASFQGGCICENPPGLRVQTLNPEIVSTMAPKPLLLVSCTGDWTANTPEVEGPMVRSVYELYGEPSGVRWTQVDAAHNYNRESREDVYEFLNEALMGNSDPAAAVEAPFEAPPVEALRVFADPSEAPPRLTREELTESLIAEKARAFSEAYPESRRELERFVDTYGPALNHSLLVDVPNPEQIQVTELGDTEVPRGVARRLVIGRAGVGDAIPAVLLLPEVRRPGRPVLLVSDSGKSVFIGPRGIGDLVSTLLAFGRPVLAIDPFLTGEAVPEPPIDRAAGIEFFATYNKTDAAERVQDIVTASVALVDLAGRPDPALVGLGDAGLWCLLAAWAYPHGPVACDLADFPLDDSAFLERLDIPLLRQAGDLRTALLARPGHGGLLVWNVHPSFEPWISRAFSASSAASKLEVADSRPQDARLAAWLLR